MALKMVYIHIPFCLSKCIYCDFYSLTNINLKDDFLKYLKKEIDLRYKNEKISSIYFGGGTPSLLNPEEIEILISSFNKTKNCEISIECNPEDIKKEKIEGFTRVGINRFSLGVQSLNNEELKILRRRHDSEEAIESIKILKESVENFNCDLIVGIKGQTRKSLKNTLRKIISFNPPHISIYPLEMKKNKSLVQSKERKAYLMESCWKYLKENGYLHYEISNFAKKGFICKHNMGYWLRRNYYGFGSSAHSLIKNKRFSNFKSIKKYFDFLKNNKLPISNIEYLNKREIEWEKFILRFRTFLGFPIKGFKEDINYLENADFIKRKRKKLFITEKGMLVYNSVILKLEPILFP